MLKNFVLILALSSSFMYEQLTSTESSRQSEETSREVSSLNDIDLSTAKNGIQFVIKEFAKGGDITEFLVSSERFYDILGKILALTKEDRTKGLFLILSDVQIRQDCSLINLDKEQLFFVIRSLNNKKKMISELIDANLLKQYFMNWDTSLEINTDLIVHLLDQEEYGKLLIELFQIPS